MLEPFARLDSDVAAGGTGAYLDYATRGRNAWWRYVCALALGLAFGLGLSAGLGIALIATGLLPESAVQQLLTPTAPMLFFPTTAATFAVLLLGFWGAVRLIQGKRFSDVRGAWRWRAFGQGAAIWAGFLVLATAADFALAPGAFKVSVGPGTLSLAVVALVSLAIQTFAEEWIFRGWVTQGVLLATRSPVAAAVLAGLIFGVVHIPNGWPQAAGAVGFGVATSWIAMRQGGFAFTFGLHLINNLFGAVVVVSAGDVFNGSPGLFTQDTPQLMWWDMALGVAGLAAVAWWIAGPRRSERPAQ